MKYLFYAFVVFIIIIATFSSNCATPSKQWFNASVEPAENVTIYLDLLTIGDGKTIFVDAKDYAINLSVNYVNKPSFEQYRDNDNLSIFTKISYGDSNDARIGADMLIYVPENATYTFYYYTFGGINQTIINNSKSNITIIKDYDVSRYRSGKDFRVIPVNI